MIGEARRYFKDAMQRANRFISEGRYDDAWPYLERAHILSQPFARLHVWTHWRMMVCGTKSRDYREVLGQLPRLLIAAPGSWSRRYAVGNTGRARVSMWRPMSIPRDLRTVFN